MDANVNANADAGGSTIALHELCSGELKRIRLKTTEKRWRPHFPLISQWRFSVAMETRVLIQSAPKPYAAFPHPSDATHKIWSRLANWLQRYSSLNVWTTMTDEWWWTDDWLLVYYKLTLWAFGSGELKSSPKDNDRSPESNVPRSIYPKTLSSLSPTQWCYT